ncbi:MAG TPA: PAS domain S-box protein [Synergistales bacterium]|nr:PAS domain S-box protein [Synergistales bacterium]HRV71739.1 PAS domain S-box protein [Thermovirgaceae bacterium]
MNNQDTPEYNIFFEKLFENSPEGVVIQGPDGTVQKANRAFCEMFGYNLEEVLGQDLDYLVARDKDIRTEASRRTVDAVSGSQFSFETIRQKKDGTRFHVTAFGVPILKDGKTVAIYGMYRDISDRKNAEEALRRSEERYRAIIEQQRDIIVRFTPDWNITFANEAYCRYYGLTADKALGRSFLSHIPETDRGKTIKHLQGLSKENPVEKTEEVTILPSGETRWQQWIDTALFDSSGNIVEYQSVGRDITDRVLMEDSLRQSTEKLEKTLDDTVRLLAGTMRIRDVYTADHQEGVARLAKAIAEEMGFSDERVKGIWVAGMIHDIGKLYIPGEILNKPTSLSNLEYEIVKRHAEVGAETLQEVSFPWPVSRIVGQHHERLDGSGYPNGLVGDEILEETRILSVADVVEAMRSHRPFRAAYSLDKALDTVREGSGKIFDERVVASCLKIFEKGFEFEA